MAKGPVPKQLPLCCAAATDSQRGGSSELHPHGCTGSAPGLRPALGPRSRALRKQNSAALPGRAVPPSLPAACRCAPRWGSSRQRPAQRSTPDVRFALQGCFAGTAMLSAAHTDCGPSRPAALPFTTQIHRKQKHRIDAPALPRTAPHRGLRHRIPNPPGSKSNWAKLSISQRSAFTRLRTPALPPPPPHALTMGRPGVRARSGQGRAAGLSGAEGGTAAGRARLRTERWGGGSEEAGARRGGRRGRGCGPDPPCDDGGGSRSSSRAAAGGSGSAGGRGGSRGGEQPLPVRAAGRTRGRTPLPGIHPRRDPTRAHAGPMEAEQLSVIAP